MKAKRTAKPPISPRAESNGIVKKKKVKAQLQNLSTSPKVAEALEAPVGDTAINSPQKNNQLKKKNKNKKSDLQPRTYSTVNSSSSNTKEVQVKNGSVNEHKPSIKTLEASNTHKPISTSNSSASSKIKKPGYTGNDLQSATGNVKNKKKAAKRKKAKRELSSIPETNEQKEQRTLFVGNVSTKTTRKSLTRFFSKYGKVETVRLRCAAVPTPATSKRQAVIRNTFHDKRTSLSAYVRFTQTAMMEAALKANGTELDQKHLQVDRSQGTSNRNNKLAVFIGNLAFEAEEEALRSHFSSCGEIESVRIVRDKKLASGKGFGYVNFVSEDAVEMALQMDGKIFMHRQLRVQRCTKQGKKGSKPSFKTQGKKGLGFMKTQPTSTKNSKRQHSFSGKKMMETKVFKKMKAKSKFTKEDRKKKAIAHKLTGGKPKMMTP